MGGEDQKVEYSGEGGVSLITMIHSEDTLLVPMVCKCESECQIMKSASTPGWYHKPDIVETA